MARAYETTDADLEGQQNPVAGLGENTVRKIFSKNPVEVVRGLHNVVGLVKFQFAGSVEAFVGLVVATNGSVVMDVDHDHEELTVR